MEEVKKFFGIEKIYCERCGVRLEKNQKGELEGMEFKDGFYCKTCGENKKKQKFTE